MTVLQKWSQELIYRNDAFALILNLSDSFGCNGRLVVSQIGRYILLEIFFFRFRNGLNSTGKVELFFFFFLLLSRLRVEVSKDEICFELVQSHWLFHRYPHTTILIIIKTDYLLWSVGLEYPLFFWPEYQIKHSPQHKNKRQRTNKFIQRNCVHFRFIWDSRLLEQ